MKTEEMDLKLNGVEMDPFTQVVRDLTGGHLIVDDDLQHRVFLYYCKNLLFLLFFLTISVIL
jgi:hypothetical protein